VRERARASIEVLRVYLKTGSNILPAGGEEYRILTPSGRNKGVEGACSANGGRRVYLKGKAKKVGIIKKTSSAPPSAVGGGGVHNASTPDEKAPGHPREGGQGVKRKKKKVRIQKLVKTGNWLLFAATETPD